MKSLVDIHSLGSNEKENITKNKLFLINSTMLTTVLVQFFINTNQYEITRLFLYTLMAIAILTSIGKIRISRKTYMYYFTIGAYFSVIFYLFISLRNSRIETAAITELVMPYLILVFGYSVNLDDFHIDRLVERYAFMVAVLGIYLIYHYGNGFQVTSVYFLSAKNQVGPMISSVSFVVLMKFFEQSITPKYSKIKLLLLFVATFSCAIYLRNRSGLVAFAICFLFYMISKIKIKRTLASIVKFFIYSIILFLIYTSGVLHPIFNSLYDSMFSNYDITSINSISAGRYSVYMQTIEFLKNHPLLGEVTALSNISETPHNYLLNKLLRYGFLGSLPIIIIYLSLWKKTIIEIFVNKESSSAIYLILFMLVVSLFEYTYPYGPLTTVSLSWFLFGQFLRRKNI